MLPKGYELRCLCLLLRFLSPVAVNLAQKACNTILKVTKSPFEGGGDPPQAESRGMIRQGMELIKGSLNLSLVATNFAQKARNTIEGVTE